MPSSLFYKANEINQRINDLQFSYFPIRWSPTAKKWVYENEKSWKRYLIISFIWKMVVISPMLQFALYYMIFKTHGIFKFRKIFNAAIVLQTIWGTFFLDFLCWTFGKEIVACCNWFYSTEKRMKFQSNNILLNSQAQTRKVSKINGFKSFFENGKNCF